jgi:hypothetical protein
MYQIYHTQYGVATISIPFDQPHLISLIRPSKRNTYGTGAYRLSFGQKESPGDFPELCMDLSECTVAQSAN